MLQRKDSFATAAASLAKGLERRWRLGEKFIEGGIFLAGLLTIIVLLGITRLACCRCGWSASIRTI